MHPVPETAVENVAETVARRLGSALRGVESVEGGGNNRLYRLALANGRQIALKTYLREASDPRDRHGAEVGGLRFLSEAGIATVPAALADDADAGWAAFSWVEGEAPREHDARDIVQALDFMASLKALRARPDADALPPASEACLAPGELIDQISLRIARLSAVRDHALVRLLDSGVRDAFWSALDRAGRRLGEAGIDGHAPLPARHETLSPSDFGFHNALKDAGGRLTFVDFEYFGRDDPVKLVSDFLLHPGMDLSAAQSRQFLRGSQALYGTDERFRDRLAALFPLYAVRWTLILLNAFLPERRARQVYAGDGRCLEQALAVQVGKAENMLTRLNDLEGWLNDDA